MPGERAVEVPRDRYAVVGHPVEHSRSPFIHARFAEQTGQRIEYGRLLAPLDGFAATVERFRAEGGRGLNVTLPFKLQAAALASELSARARAAQAVNTLRFDDGAVFGDNTDGIGLVRDIEQRCGCRLAGRHVLLLGAGGAARGIALPLLEAGVQRLFVANRTEASAKAVARAAADARVRAGGFDAIDAAYDVIVNATSAGLAGGSLPLPPQVFAAARLALDMMYGARPTAFMRQALEAGCRQAVDGLGMLVEQAAESFTVWRGVRPATEPVYRALREMLDREAASA